MVFVKARVSIARRWAACHPPHGRARRRAGARRGRRARAGRRPI